MIMTLLYKYTFDSQYEVRGRPKSVVYWLAELQDPSTPVRLSEEHTAFEWLALSEAKHRVEFSDMQGLLQECDSFICSH